MAQPHAEAHLVLENKDAAELLSTPGAAYAHDRITKAIADVKNKAGEAPPPLVDLPCQACALEMILDPRAACDHKLGTYWYHPPPCTTGRLTHTQMTLPISSSPAADASTSSPTTRAPGLPSWI